MKSIYPTTPSQQSPFTADFSNWSDEVLKSIFDYKGRCRDFGGEERLYDDLVFGPKPMLRSVRSETVSLDVASEAVNLVLGPMGSGMSHFLVGCINDFGDRNMIINVPKAEEVQWVYHDDNEGPLTDRRADIFRTVDNPCQLVFAPMAASVRW